MTTYIVTQGIQGPEGPPGPTGPPGLSGSSTLDGLDDVDTTTAAPSTDDVLAWDGTAGMWVPMPLTGYGTQPIDGGTFN